MRSQKSKVEVIKLNKADSRHLAEILTAPARPPTKRMVEAVRTYRKTVKSK